MLVPASGKGSNLREVRQSYEKPEGRRTKVAILQHGETLKIVSERSQLQRTTYYDSILIKCPKQVNLLRQTTDQKGLRSGVEVREWGDVGVRAQGYEVTL